MSIIHDGSSTSSLSYADRVRLVTSDQPFRWLGSGWRDFLAAPAASLCYGLLFVIIGPDPNDRSKLIEPEPD